MVDLMRFAARVQALLGLLLVGTVMILSFALAAAEVYLAVTGHQADDTLKALLNAIVTADIQLASGGAVAFWLSRHRPENEAGADDGKNGNGHPTQPAGQPAQPGGK